MNNLISKEIRSFSLTMWLGLEGLCNYVKRPFLGFYNVCLMPYNKNPLGYFFYLVLAIISYGLISVFAIGTLVVVLLVLFLIFAFFIILVVVSLDSCFANYQIFGHVLLGMIIIGGFVVLYAGFLESKKGKCLTE